MLIEKVAELVADTALSLLQRELESEDDQLQAAKQAAILLEQKILRQDAQAVLDARRARNDGR